MTDDLPDKLFFKPADLAVLFDVKIKTVYSWCQTGQVDSIKIAGTLRIPRAAVIEAMKKDSDI